VENVIAHQVRQLRGAGYPVTVVAGRGGADEAFTGARVVIIPELDSECAVNCGLTEQLGWGLVPQQFRLVQSRIEDALLPVLADTDILVAHNVFNYHFNLPLIASLHDLIDHGIIRRPIAWCHDISRYINPLSGSSLRFGYPWGLLRTYRPEVTYVAVSQQRQRLLAQVLGCLPQQIRVIPNGVAPNLLLGLGALGRHLVEEFQLLEADLVLLMPIRVTRAKNIKRALHIAAALKNLGLGPRMVITGPPDPHSKDGDAYLGELVALRHELNLDQEVHFIYEGTSRFPRPLTIGPSVVADLYRVCDLVLLTSDREGFGLPIVEGGLAGKAVFTTEVPALEGIEHGLVHCIARDQSPEETADRIWAWSQGDATFRFRRQVRQQYTWSAIFQRSIVPLLSERMEFMGVPT
jgi:glycosyltransferase involved in cell wall biosynthesis